MCVVVQERRVEDDPLVRPLGEDRLGRLEPGHVRGLLTGAWELDPQVALRPEPFGALAYHYGNRRLTFLRSSDLVELVRSLGDHGSGVSP